MTILSWRTSTARVAGVGIGAVAVGVATVTAPGIIGGIGSAPGYIPTRPYGEYSMPTKNEAARRPAMIAEMSAIFLLDILSKVVGEWKSRIKG